MRIGGDTGFLIGVIEEEDSALKHWQGILDGSDELALSALTICELLVHYYKRGKGEAAKKLIGQIRLLGNATILSVTESIAEQAAGYRHGLGIPTMDALILATVISQKCDLIVTVDSDFERPAKQGLIQVVMLS